MVMTVMVIPFGCSNSQKHSETWGGGVAQAQKHRLRVWRGRGEKDCSADVCQRSSLLWVPVLLPSVSIPLLLTSGFLGFGRAGFGHLDCLLAFSVEHDFLQGSWTTLCPRSRITLAPVGEPVFAIADVLLPVAGDFAFYFLSVVIAGGFADPGAAVSSVRNTSAIGPLVGITLRTLFAIFAISSGSRPFFVSFVFVGFCCDHQGHEKHYC